MVFPQDWRSGEFGEGEMDVWNNGYKMTTKSFGENAIH
jgi:hypothetical protein